MNAEHYEYHIAINNKCHSKVIVNYIILKKNYDEKKPTCVDVRKGLNKLPKRTISRCALILCKEKCRLKQN